MGRKNKADTIALVTALIYLMIAVLELLGKLI